VSGILTTVAPALITPSTVSLIRNDKTITEAATGDGPVDAAFNAIERVVGFNMDLQSYNIKAVTEGKDALGEAIVRASYGGKVFIGRGISTDIVEASVKAFLNAINRAVSDFGEDIITEK